MQKNKKNNYIDNEKFFNEMVAYREAYDLAIINNTEKPRPSEYIGKCLLDIAKNFATKYHFAKFYFVEEMVGDALVNCLTYLHKFDPNKTKNPFSYFTQVTFYAFLRRIKLEKEEWETKQAIFKNIDPEILEMIRSEYQQNGWNENKLMQEITEIVNPETGEI